MRAPTICRLFHGGGLLIAGGIGAVALGISPAHANGSSTPVTFLYDICKDGICPSGPGPYLTATIENLINPPVPGSEGVTIKLKSNLQSGQSFPGSEPVPVPPNGTQPPNILAIAFNFTDPFPANIVTTCSGSGCRDTAPQSAVADPGNSQSFPSGTPFDGFDLALYLDDDPAFDGTQEVTFTLFAPVNLNNPFTASKFNTPNAQGYCTAAQVNGIPSSGGTSSTIIANFCGDTLPSKVPAPLPILGAGMAFGFSRRLRRRVCGAEDALQASID